MTSEGIWLKLKASSGRVNKRCQIFQAHSQAGEKHSETFPPFLSEYATGEREGLAVQAAKKRWTLTRSFEKGLSGAQNSRSIESGFANFRLTCLTD